MIDLSMQTTSGMKGLRTSTGPLKNYVPFNHINPESDTYRFYSV